MRLPDVHRSLRRWTTLVLGDDWIVRTEQRLSSPDDLSRDTAFVEIAVPSTTVSARSAIPQGNVDRMATFSVTLLPAPSATPQESSLRAYELAETLQSAMEIGLVTDTGGFYCWPMSFPLWSWEGVPIVGTGRAGPQSPPLVFAEVHDLSVRPLPDPDDDRLYSVIMTLRAMWRAAGRAGFPAPPAVGGVTPSVDPPLRG